MLEGEFKLAGSNFHTSKKTYELIQLNGSDQIVVLQV